MRHQLVVGWFARWTWDEINQLVSNFKPFGLKIRMVFG